MGPVQNLSDLLNLLRRRMLLIGVIVLLGCIASVMVAISRPKVYETAAVIQVEGPVVLDAGPNSGAQSARLLQAIEQRLTTRESLLALIDRQGLFADAPGLTDDQKIWALRQSVRFESVAAAAGAGYGTASSVSALVIFARFENAEQAARVANDLAQNVLDLSVARQTSRAKDTLAFFTEEEARLAQEISVLEDELTAYKNANLAALGRTDTGERVALDTELRQAQQDLLALQTERKALEAKPRQRETDRRQIESLSAQEGVLQSQIDALTVQRDALDQRQSAAPEVERTLSAYDRRLQQLQSQYDLTNARRAEAETALRLEEEQHSERFSLLERATAPAYPTSGGGKKIALAGGMASVMLALVAAFALDLMNPVLRSAAQMERQLGIRPVITIPELPRRRPGHSLLKRLWQSLGASRSAPPPQPQD
ncbi:Uncharacterized protein involved in exopolysaccharide biosynthesis [Gemmobacter aquatilis]|uniref:Uncharacterized protein involved in exopolysaccharide biosynthesis n=1 Tax=Gemmobacter aquatilis TaxID=933059 RepID=A0A1H8JTF2_9RHOB|nr:Wzz/FepE/Etk N-terminal domain-containing protein [Gemmobacter aquatilis]SEN83982.1 Uncharacterized protein involved in exopolysaccharide biosynthesis [Gemmobacter aquatilis]